MGTISTFSLPIWSFPLYQSCLLTKLVHVGVNFSFHAAKSNRQFEVLIVVLISVAPHFLWKVSN